MEHKPIHSSDELIERAVTIAREGRRKTVAVAAAQDMDVLSAVSEANADGFLDGVLIGDEGRIKAVAGENGIGIDKLSVVNEPNPIRAAHAAAKLAGERRADAIMKGFLPTAALLKAVLTQEYGLRGENTLSHCAVLDIPGYHKLLNITDGGMVIKPTVEQKYQILENAVLVSRALRVSPVRIAVSAATDRPSARMPHTLSDTDSIVPMALKRLDDIFIQSPLPLDLASSRETAEKGQARGEVVGEADIYLVNSVEEGNIVSKSLIQFSEAVFAGVIVGAKVPVSLVSRADTVKNKKASLALACVVADYLARNGVWGQ